MMKVAHFSVLTPLEFLEDVADTAKQAKVRVWAQAMEVEPGKHTDILLDALVEASRRGIDTKLHIDAFSFMVTDGVFNYWPFVSGDFRRLRRKRLAKKRMMISRLEEAGVVVLPTNPPTLLDRILPTRGRNHMKIVVIDDVSWIGGVNFHEGNFTSQDTMIRITDPAITSEIAYIYDLVDKQELKRDMNITCTEDTSLLVDSGQINRSLILRQAITCISQAKKSLAYISLLIPDSDVLIALGKARKRTKDFHLILPSSSKVSGIFHLVDLFNAIMMSLRRVSLPITYKDFPIHAKVLIIDEKTVLVGSHNFSSRGVRMGTEEIAIQSTNPVLVNNLIKFYADLSVK